MSKPWGTILMVLVLAAGTAAILWAGRRAQAERARKAGKEPEATSLTGSVVTWLLALAIFMWVGERVSPTGMWENVLLVVACGAAGIVLNAVIERYLARRAEAARPDDEQACS